MNTWPVMKPSRVRVTRRRLGEMLSYQNYVRITLTATSASSAISSCIMPGYLAEAKQDLLLQNGRSRGAFPTA